MADLYQRAFKLNVGGTEIDASAGVTAQQLRVAFAIERTERRVPNSCEVRIWNLNSGHRAALDSAASVTVQLEAGYVGSIGTIFLGDLRSARTRREGADYVTTVSGGDGEAAIRTARINRTFSAGSSVADVLRGLAQSLGLPTGNLGQIAATLSGRLGRATTLSGLTYDELESFTRTHGVRWSVQDGALQFRTGDEPVGGQGPLLRADSGLIGTPEREVTQSRTADGKLVNRTLVSGTSLLRPDLVPGRAVRVESEAFTGNVVLISTTHRGDSTQAEWYCDFTARPY